MATKKVSPAVTPAREGRERALVQNAVMDTNALPLRGSGEDTSRPAILDKAPEIPHRPLTAADIGKPYKPNKRE